MKPIGLTDEQLLTIQRTGLSRRLGSSTAPNGHEIGDGLVGRVVREAQHQFLRVPELEPKKVPSRWDRDAPRFDKVSRRAF
jgi:hypothetical protein